MKDLARKDSKRVMKITIREYSPKDKAAVEKCILELQEDENSHRNHYWAEPTQELASAYLDYTINSVKNLPDAKIFVGVFDEATAGWMVVSVATEDGPDVKLKKYGYISELAVQREFHNKGIGSALMAKGEDLIKSLGLEWMELNVSPQNPALNFYRKSGYEEVSVRMEKKIK
jgi:ribosomal protein S18 acetylase RimI-like enzyme